MSKRIIWQLAAFVAILIGLNLFFGLHISIIGSLVLTILLSVAFSLVGRRR